MTGDSLSKLKALEPQWEPRQHYDFESCAQRSSSNVLPSISTAVSCGHGRNSVASAASPGSRNSSCTLPGFSHLMQSIKEPAQTSADYASSHSTAVTPSARTPPQFQNPNPFVQQGSTGDRAYGGQGAAEARSKPHGHSRVDSLYETQSSPYSSRQSSSRSTSVGYQQPYVATTLPPPTQHNMPTAPSHHQYQSHHDATGHGYFAQQHHVSQHQVPYHQQTSQPQQHHQPQGSEVYDFLRSSAAFEPPPQCDYPQSYAYPSANQAEAWRFQQMHAVHSQPTRKKRGNLPKEATDKLMKWFFLHEDAPYPTEEQKNEIVRQTNLAMSQISNWFINARRRIPSLPKPQLNALRSSHLNPAPGEEPATVRSVRSRARNAQRQTQDASRR